MLKVLLRSVSRAWRRKDPARRQRRVGYKKESVGVDEEAPGVPRRRLVQSVAHMAIPYYPVDEQPQSPSMDADDLDLVRYYETTVRALQDKAGDNDHAPIQGNLYSYMALKSFGEQSGLFQNRASPTMLAGLVFVVIVQIVGPLAVFLWAYYQLDWFPDGHIVSWKHINDTWRYEPGSNDHGVSKVSAQFLGTIFVILFCLNGSYVMRSDMVEMQKTWDMCELFSAVSLKTPAYPSPNTAWLWFGCVVNCWCVFMCALCLVPLFILAEDGPKDIIYDGLALTFLYNLDDVSGDMGFLDEKWDEDQFGDIYGGLADQIATDDGEMLIKSIREERDSTFTTDNLYYVGYLLLLALTFTLPFVFVFGNIHVKPEQADAPPDADDLHRTVSVLQEQVRNLTLAFALEHPQTLAANASH